MEDRPRLTIDNEKLIDIIMHSATRDDIRELKNEILAKHDDLNRKIDSFQFMNDKRLDKIDQELGRMEDDIKTNFKWVCGLILFSMVLPIASKYLGI
jgi:short-subunit dehydrogenase involved in D-alanine esterification of teichoic acids